VEQARLADGEAGIVNAFGPKRRNSFSFSGSVIITPKA
jgi:hypothetical protein